MRYKISLFVLICVVSLSLCWTSANAEVQEIETKIDAAMSHFFGPATPGADSQKGFIYLIDAIEMTAPHTGFGEEFAGKIKEANSLFKSKSIFNEDGVALLHAGYTAINAGKDFEMPEEISSIGDARDYARKQIVSAKKCLKNRDFDRSVKLLLEVAVMVVTPMIQER